MAGKQRGVWVLDTETKGTGAHVAPLREGETPVPEAPLALVDLAPVGTGEDAAAAEEPGTREPLRFRVVDVMSSDVLAEDVDARGAIAALEQLPHAVDALVFVRSRAGARWRLLSAEDRRTLWGFRGRATARP